MTVVCVFIDVTKRDMVTTALWNATGLVAIALWPGRDQLQFSFPSVDNSRSFDRQTLH